MTTTGPGILENQKQMLGTKSRLVWETDLCKSAAATMQLPSEAQRFATIDLRIDDNCKWSPPHPPNPPPGPGPPPRGLPSQLAQPGSMWPCQNFYFVVVLLVYGGTFQLNTHLCLGTGRRFFGERQRMKTNDALRLIIEPLLPENGAEAHDGVHYKWP